MRFILFFLCLLALAFSEKDETIHDYSEFYATYGCSVKSVNKCCWKNYNSGCDPDAELDTCKDKLTVCCKKKVYDMSEGYVIAFYSY